MPDGTYLGVLDRFEGEQAVLVLELDGEDVADLVVERARLPREGRHQDAVFRVELADGEPTRLRYRPGLTRKRGRDAQRRFDRLARRPPREATEERPDDGRGTGDGRETDEGTTDEGTTDDQPGNDQTTE